ncbi:hypothetical protein TIN4_21 [Tsukamurella phage TIN4]|uniref:Minor tail protein n=2 Tax=Tinduovirus TIN3 TaxID=1982571 RepID=A0A0K0N682_9CAUD|nr:hypothetical protein AVT54_gp104 [Tsukamurella phage TIN3]YP_009604151.1 hypothetical protein FDH87_gp104 [Tsukamurella phage TIN4]AKJ71818.1 hypothetical protein TIN3_21 [Tsukamurella phage TIN3]AKJ71927.1 hypothetical protein TIN4_21 [Tsukamurella phage TIN4]
MATGFGEWANTVQAHKVLTQIAANEVQRLRPASRLAEVTAIDTIDKSLMVRFVGETNEVRVPYTSTSPANTGQYVRVGGTMHDRHVEDVVGTTATEARLADTENHVDSLMTSILGNEWANDDDGESGSFIDRITDFFGSLGGNNEDLLGLIGALADNPLGTINDAKAKIKSMLESAFGLIDPSRIPLLPASHIGKAEPDILANYTFDSAITIDTTGAWTWDETEGHTAPGSARTTANGSRRVLTSVPIKVDELQKLEVAGWVKWAGVTAVGNAFQIVILASNDTSPVSETVVQSITNPATNGVWTKMAGSYTVPEGITSVRVRLVVTSTTTVGTVWFDDMSMSKTNTVKQGLITNLIPDLSGLWGNFTSVFEKITGVIGAGPTQLQQWIAQLKNILSGISIPGGDLFPTLSQAINGAISNVQTFAQNLLNGILSGIRKIPVVGGSIADVISEITGLKDTTESAIDAAGTAQTTADMAHVAADNAVSTAVDTVKQGLNNAGPQAAPIQSALRSFIDLIFGSGTSSGSTPTVRWTQEIYLCAGPVILGLNDIPLGFELPYNAAITSITARTSEHVTTGTGSRVVVQVRKNGTVIHTMTWNGGVARYTSGALNITGLTVNDVITFNVIEVSSRMADMSITVAGRYS